MLKPLVRGTALLGEGPCWDAEAGRLWWFDIQGRKLFWTTADGKSAGGFDLPARASVAAPTSDGRLFIVSEIGILEADRKSGKTRPIVPAPDWPEGFRSNDGKLDMQGRLWWSGMDDNDGTRPAAIYRFDGRSNRRMLDGVHIANAMAFSPDGRTYYLADSKKGTIWAFDLDPETGELGERRVFARPKHGGPDGAAIDAEGFLWVAIWGGWRVERYAPDGRLDRTVMAPVAQPSACIFGGEDLGTLFVTSARVGLSDKALARQPLAGSLFAFRPGVSGVTIPPLRV